MFNVIRIPTKFIKPINRLSKNDKLELFDYILKIGNGEEIVLPDTGVGDLLSLIYGEWMNMESRNGTKPKKSLVIDSSEGVGTDTPSKSEHRVEYNRIEESRIEENTKNNIIISKETELSLRPITNDINNLIFELKNTCDELGIAYDKKRERNFAKHILTAKEFLDFCTKIEMLPAEFAKNILRASVKIKYWKGPCAGPMTIYQNYSEVYNQTKEKKPRENIVYSNEI